MFKTGILCILFIQGHLHISKNFFNVHCMKNCYIQKLTLRRLLNNIFIFNK